MSFGESLQALAQDGTALVGFAVSATIGDDVGCTVCTIVS